MSKVLHIIDTGGPGGAETVFMRLAAGLRDQGMESVTMVSREGWLAEQLRAQELNPIIAPPGAGRLAYVRTIIEIARRENVTAIVAHLLGAGFYASIAGAVIRLPVVSVFHGQKDLDSSRLNRLKGRILSVPRGHSVFVSEALRDDLRPRLGLTADRCAVIHNGVNIARFRVITSDLRQRLGIRPETLLIGAVGNIREPKAYDIMLRAAADVIQQDPSVMFIVAGEEREPLSGQLRGLHRELGLGDRFRFIGLVDDIPNLLAGIDLFALSSRKEGFSIACIEAMAAGLPVVATRSGGPESIVESGQTGLLVETDDSTALANAILALARDSEARYRMGAAGRAAAKTRFSLERCVDAYQQLLVQLEAA